MKNSQMITAVTACFIAAASTFTSFAAEAATGPALQAEQKDIQSEIQQTTDEAGHPLIMQAPDGSTASYAGEFRVSAYSAEEYGSSLTASGVRAKANHTIAADTGVFPMGTRLLIDGTVYTVEDTGSAIRGNRLDIFFNTNRECYNFGVRNVSVYRLENAD
ncbi:3D domain-containing protein [[Clostridium] aminophilum]|uniref:3D domain-containing protein n=1 Tax=[Clostridium] aminophilum TaxID=1526 RepID=UPI003F9C7BC4